MAGKSLPTTNASPYFRLRGVRFRPGDEARLASVAGQLCQWANGASSQSLLGRSRFHGCLRDACENSVSVDRGQSSLMFPNFPEHAAATRHGVHFDVTCHRYLLPGLPLRRLEDVVEVYRVGLTRLRAGLLASATFVGLGAVAIPGSGASVAQASVNWSKVAHLTASGKDSMSALVAAAKKEGVLNVITLPANWANYGTIINDFQKKYGIKINSENPDGSSQDELNAIKADAGRSDDPDVLDVGQSFGVEAAAAGELAPYEVKTWANIPTGQKAPNGDWYGDYGGYVAIGCNTKTVSVCPTSFKQMLETGKGYKIGINNNPTQASAAFSAVFAAALANGGSFNNIKPGVDYFQKLNQEGNFVATVAGPSTVQSGATNIVIWWDYLQASEINSLPSFAKTWKVVIPTDASYAAYYDQAINKQAPDPAAARLWEEYLYSTTGQNLWLEGEARPIELPSLVAASTANKTALAALPAAPAGTTNFPTLAQITKAQAVVAADWPTEVTSGP